LRPLLDTHAVLSVLAGEALAPRAQDAVDRADPSVLVSAVSVWEIAIKRALGKLRAPEDLLERLEYAGVELLSITARHAHATAELPFHHSDPFDRLLVAQAQLEGCALVTRDRALDVYGVPVVW
jgi:PIN domain nuclease of toxin-antitoxin system